jgi:hypothetical protein
MRQRIALRGGFQRINAVDLTGRVRLCKVVRARRPAVHQSRTIYR